MSRADWRPERVRLSEKIWRRPTAAARLQPGFVNVGARKSGMRAPFQHLPMHPLVLPSLSREVLYFDFKYQRGPGWHLAQFPRRRPDTWVTCESLPGCTPHSLAPSRAAAFDPHMKLIAVLRHPVERALSHHAVATRCAAVAT